MRGGDQGEIEEPHIAARAQDGGSGGKGCTPVCQRPCKGQSNLPGATIGNLLAVGVGVGKKPANGKQQNGAQPQSKPRRHQQTGSLTHHNGRHQKHKQRKPARPTILAANGKQHQKQEREKDVDAHLHTHPAAQRD